MLLVCAFLVGMVSGLRSMLAPAVVSWAARLGLLEVSGTSLAFMGYGFTSIVFALLAIGELIADKLPFTPSRKIVPAFTARIFSGALVGATIGASGNLMLAALVTGAIGAAVGTVGGANLRGRLAAAFHRDLPAAVLEDVFGLALAIIAVVRIR